VPATGKLRHLFDWNNFKDPFRVLKGVNEVYRIIRKARPDVLTSLPYSFVKAVTLGFKKLLSFLRGTLI
jgi:UDP-N-acetylglucosamine:LPS N-acetylglucosamine transferase